MQATPPTCRLSSSLRTRSAEESLAIVAPLARSRGITRVVDTTWLDRIGIPVYASIRPDGMDGNIWVHAGKGFTHAEAKIGAYMEALEFSFGEPGRNAASWFMSTPQQVVASFGDAIAFADFAPLVGYRAQADDAIAVVRAQEIRRGLGEVQVPGELVFLPFRLPGVQLYGCNTNGLASGNTLAEATAHGLAEVMERHVHSFEQLDDRSVRVDLASAPPKVRALAEAIERAGMTPVLRHSTNVFGMAYFSAYVLEPDEHHPVALARGHGFHPIREIAAVRALAEAVQSRLTCIHGGREDLIDQHAVFESLGERKTAAIRARRERLLDARGLVAYADVPDFDTHVASIDDATRLMFDALGDAGLQHVARVVLTEPDYPFQVVKLVVPGAEFFNREAPRVGPRLLRHFQHA